MLRNSLGFIIAIAGFLALAATLWTYLKPAYPVVSSAEYQRVERGRYSAGRARCQPARLNSLPKQEAADERYRCDQAAEQQRLRGEDLVQQTRAADAAVALVGLTYAQALMLLAGTILGLLTLVAAFSAAWYAKRAAEVAEEGLKNTKDMALLELRPYVHVDEIYFQPPGAGERRGPLTVTVKNFGSTPAIRFHIEAGWGVRDSSTIGALRRVNLRLRRYACTDEIPQGHAVTISLLDERLTPKGENLAVFCTVFFRYSDKFGSEYMRWETYIMEGPHTLRGQFRFYHAT